MFGKKTDRVEAVDQHGSLNHVIEHVTEDLPEGVTERFRTKFGDGPEQIVTAFAPSQAAHAEYPPELPFIPFTATYVTQYPGNEMPPGARWQTSDPNAIAEFLIAQSRADGWHDAPPDEPRVKAIRSFKQPMEVKSTFMLKSGVLRTILIAHVGADSLVQLLDAPPV
jgi:hypothetical protein